MHHHTQHSVSMLPQQRTKELTHCAISPVLHLNFFNLTYVYECFACIYASVPSVCQCPKRPKEGADTLELDLEEICKPSRWWRDNSAVKSICCSYRGLRFNSQHPHSASQLSITLIQGDLMPSSDFQEHQACT